MGLGTPTRGDGATRADPSASLFEWWELQRRLVLAPERSHALLVPHDSLASLAATKRLPPHGDPPNEALLARLEAEGWWALPWADPRYPEPLRALSDPPAMLWVRGDEAVFAAPRVAIVGARRATQYGVDAAIALARGAAAAGAVVVSGLARGVDAAAHRGALAGRASGPATVAVLAHGPDFLYPAAHRGLAEEIVRRGALVTEFPPGVGPRKHYFPLRNRIISGLCRAVVVAEARRRSGSLLTARHALEQGREVLAVPGPIDLASSEGPNLLLRDGAGVALGADDLLAALGLATQEAPGVEEAPPLLRAIAEGPVSLDDLARRTGLEVDEVAREVVALELDGRVRVGPDGRIVAER